MEAEGEVPKTEKSEIPLQEVISVEGKYNGGAISISFNLTIRTEG
jgi:hypothetical protein